MKFGPVAPGDALGATAVHSIRQGGLVLKKGTLIGPKEVAALKAAGVEIDRKMLADIAVKDAAAFTQLAEQAKASLGAIKNKA